MLFADEPEHVLELRRMLKQFVSEEMPAEKVRQWDKEHRFPPELFAKLAETGVCGITIAPEYGGQGPDLVAAVAIIEELCRGGAFAAGPFIHSAFYGGMNISENGSEEQKAHYLPQLARGEHLFAYGLSEPDVGGDLASVRCRADRTDDGRLIVNGFKRWCTGAEFADTIYCLVRTGAESARHRNLSFVLIPTDVPGITIHPIEHGNLRYTLSSDVILEDVELSSDQVVGGEEGWNEGWGMLAGRALDVERLEITAVTFGIAQAAVEEAWAYSQDRKQFGRPISGHQAVRHRLVEARTRLEACRHMLYHAAWLADTGRPCSVESAMAKLSCQRVMGAYGLSEGHDMERHVRDLIGMPIVGGSSDMQKNNIAGLLGLAR
jgi:alkylation response protein AidB-like acyl-CoA dehydrogenase